jgi:opacity protein-like surface antigen
MGFLFKSKADFSSSKQDVNNVDVNSPDPADKFTLHYTGQPDPLNTEVNFFRSSLIIGAGVQYNVFGNTMLIAGLRYDNALTDFTAEDRWKAKLNFVALHLGVLF